MKYLFFLFASLLLISCTEEIFIDAIRLPIEEATSGVKSKTYYPSTEFSQVLNIEDFEYENRRLQKKIYYSGDREMIYHYEQFIYNSDGKLIYKLNYHRNYNSPTGYILLDSTVYTYSGDLLVTETILAPYGDYYYKYQYEYEGLNLVKKIKYNKEELDSYTTYEYKNRSLHKEINYNKGNSVTELKEYKYSGDALIELVYYNYRNGAKRKITYSYNQYGKLILEEVDELFIASSSLPYVIKYLY